MFIAIMLLSACTAAMAQENEAGARTISWSVTASYYSEALKKDFPCTLVAYTDGTYAIKGVYGSEDDIEFKIDNEHMVECESASKEKYYVPEIAFTNYYKAQGTYYYFGAGEYTVCVYYAQGTGYSAWEGDTAEPCLWFYTYLYQGESYIGGGYDNISWNKSDVSSITSAIAGRTPSDRMYTITGVACSKEQKMPAGIYIKNGKKFIVRK